MCTSTVQETSYRIVKRAPKELEKEQHQRAWVVWWHLALGGCHVLFPKQVRHHHVAQGKAAQPARKDLVQVLRHGSWCLYVTTTITHVVFEDGLENAQQQPGMAVGIEELVHGLAGAYARVCAHADVHLDAAAHRRALETGVGVWGCAVRCPVTLSTGMRAREMCCMFCSVPDSAILKSVRCRLALTASEGSSSGDEDDNMDCRGHDTLAYRHRWQGPGVP